MEEEGTVVYFETSPSAVDLKQHVDTLSEDNLIFHSNDGTTQPHTGTSLTESEQEHRSLYVTTLWRQLVDVLRLKVQGWLDSAYALEASYKDKVVTHIKNSPLLTEEDFQLLHITRDLASDNQQHPSQLQSTNSQTDTKLNMWCILLTSISALLIAIAATVMTCPLFLLPIALLCTGLLTRRILRAKSEAKITNSFNDLDTYSTNFETLLSLLTQAVRIIQETEIITHGFSRPSQSVPIGRLDRQSSKLQCAILRKRVFGCCQRGVGVLRGVTERLCVKYPLCEELDERQGYLVFRPLSELHQYLSLKEEEKGEGEECLKLESLKDACNLLAVQNSELLRRLTLVVSCRPHKTPDSHQTDSTSTVSRETRGHSLTAVLQCLREPLEYVQTACEDLKWSVEFHRNSLFGDPPSRTEVVERKKDDDTPLQPVAEEVHCMDLKTQVTLQRIRYLGEQLLHDGDSDSGQIREQLMLIQHNLEGVMEHISDSLHHLDEMEKTAAGCSQHSQGGGPLTTDSPETHNEEDGDQLPVNEGSPCNDDNEEEEEVVYEAYVPLTGPEGEVEGCVDDQLLSEEERQILERQQREAREVPLHMLKELNSVLAVRNTEKERRRQERRKKRENQQQQQEDTLHPSPSNNTEAPPPTLSNTANTTDLQPRESHDHFRSDTLDKHSTTDTLDDPFKTDAQSNVEIPEKTEHHLQHDQQFEHYSKTDSCKTEPVSIVEQPSLQDDLHQKDHHYSAESASNVVEPLHHSAIAQAVAAAASLRRRRGRGGGVEGEGGDDVFVCEGEEEITEGE